MDDYLQSYLMRILLFSYITFTIVTFLSLITFIRYVENPAHEKSRISKAIMRNIIENKYLLYETNSITLNYLLHANIIKTNEYEFLLYNPNVFRTFTLSDNKTNIVFFSQTLFGNNIIYLKDILNTNYDDYDLFIHEKRNPSLRLITKAYYKFIIGIYLLFPLLFILSYPQKHSSVLSGYDKKVRLASWYIFSIVIGSVSIYMYIIFFNNPMTVFLDLITICMLVFLLTWLSMFNEKEKYQGLMIILNMRFLGFSFKLFIILAITIVILSLLYLMYFDFIRLLLKLFML